MKRYFFISILITSLCQINAQTDYPLQAKLWIQEYIQSPSSNSHIEPAQLHIILNLLYLSYERAQATLLIQPIAQKTFQGLWQGWSNVINQRLDASQKPVHDLCAKKEKNNALLFWAAYLHYQQVTKTYNNAVQKIIYGNLLSSTLASLAIHTIREKIHYAIIDAFTDIRQYVYTFLSASSQPNRGFIDSISTFISSYFPPLIEQSFIKANEMNITMSGEVWELFRSAQDIGIYLWNHVEQTRALFYKAHYEALYAHMRTLYNDDRYFSHLFNENGIITDLTEQILLPHTLT